MNTNDNPDVLGFCSFITENGERHYGCRGIGPSYNAFYNWVYKTSYECTSEDFPWDYFIFRDIKDEQSFLKIYASEIDYQTDSSLRPAVVTPEFQKDAEEHFNTMEDNTQVDHPDKQLSFIKMNMPREHIDFIMDYYHLKNVPEVNQAAIYVLKTLAHMEKDGYKFAIFKSVTIDGKAVMDGSSFGLEISDMIKSILKQISKES